MEFSIQRETLLFSLQLISGVVERKQVSPILSNVLLVIKEGELYLTATDLEVELTAKAEVQTIVKPGMVTVSARKLMDICKVLPNDSTLKLSLQNSRMTVKVGQSRFTLAILDAQAFPYIETVSNEVVELSQRQMFTLLEKTHFSIALQDVRYYLNGLLLDITATGITAVGANGHRMATRTLTNKSIAFQQKLIVPRKGIVELLRLLKNEDNLIRVEIGQSSIKIVTEQFTFTSKLVDSKFPDYQKIIPRNSKKLLFNKEILRAALLRVAVLSHEKYRGIFFKINDHCLQIIASNSEKEQAEESITVDYSGECFEVGLNVNYLIEALGAIDAEEVCFSFSNPDSSVLLEGNTVEDNSLYVIMPMRL